MKLNNAQNAKIDQIAEVRAEIDNLEATVKAEIRRAMQIRRVQLDDKLARHIQEALDIKVPKVRAREAAKMLDWLSWSKFMTEHFKESEPEPEQGFRVTELVGYRDYGYVAARITFSDGTVIDVPVYMLLTKYKSGLVPEVVFLTPEQLAAIRAFVSATPTDVWVASEGKTASVMGSEEDVDAAIAKSPRPEYGPKKKNLHEYIFEHLDREEAGLNAHQ